MYGFLICALLTMLFGVSNARAAESAIPANAYLQAVMGADKLSPGLKNSLYYECLQRGRIDLSCLSRVNFSDYVPWMGPGKSAGMELQSRMSKTLNPLIAYPGGQMLHNAVMAGMEFYAFSQDITTYGNQIFHTGYSLKNSMGSSFKTGFFLNF